MRLPLPPPRGFTLVEMIVVVFLLALAMLGILSVFDASARINKSEQDVADAQGAVRYGIYSMTRAIRMAGSGGLYVTQAVLNKGDKELKVVDPSDVSYDNVPADTSVVSLNGKIKVRPGTDMIEVRGVINSPLVGFDRASGCAPCTPTGGCSPCNGTTPLTVAPITNTGHYNDDPADRPQFAQIDAYTSGAAANNMLVLVSFNDDIHPGCALTSGGQALPLYPQAPYKVGAIIAPTNLVGAKSFGSVNFADPTALEFNPETPAEAGSDNVSERNIRHAGILDDLIFFIDNTNPFHPALAQGTLRGTKFDVVTLADDVEDMQIAYGVDLDGNNAINIKAGKKASFDPNVSSEVDGDEWAPNVLGEAPFVMTDFQSLQPPPNPVVFTHPGTATHCPRLHAVMISLVAKSHDPDPTYKAPSAHGFVTMNSPTTSPNPREYPGLAPATFRRRIQMLKINLRNYAFEGG